MSFNAIIENKILVKISESAVLFIYLFILMNSSIMLWYNEPRIVHCIYQGVTGYRFKFRFTSALEDCSVLS